MLKFARRMGVDYVVADETTISRRRPELYAILLGDEPARPASSWCTSSPSGARRSGSSGSTPCRRRRDQPPLPLGYVSD